jgi:signal transduction histidine kinase
MLPRGLSKRIFLAFAALGVAMLLTVSASLFVVLRQAHRDDIQKSLVYEVAGVEASLLANPVADQGGYETRIKKIAASIVDDGGFILVQGPRGLIRLVAGSPSSTEMPPAPATNVKNAAGTLKTSDGNEYVYIEPNANATGGYKFVFAVPDDSAKQALSDILRTLSIIVLVLLVIGIPIAWLLARSVTAPMRRLAEAARDLPTASGEATPLPLEGPTEVKALTERFNAMAREIATIRHEETALLANLRHDLRTPLTSIGGFAEAIADGTASGERATAAARTIVAETQRLDRLVGELGVVERLRDGAAALRPEALDAAELLGQASDRFNTRATDGGITVDVEAAAPGEPRLLFTADRLAAERILQNLMENALAILPPGSHIWLRASPLSMPGRAPSISFSVTDDGPGFPPGTTEKVFERFFRADPSRTGAGSGLGLAIVRELARAHGGEAWAENVAPHGARVTVLLPVQPVVSAGPKPPVEAGK